MKYFNPTFFASRSNKIFRVLNRFLNNCDIEDKIPKSTIFYHSGNGVVIARGVKLGNNVKIFQGVTLGKKINDKEGFPNIKNNATFLPNCTVVGNITIGRDAIIGSNTYIDKDVASGCMVFRNNKGELIEKRMIVYSLGDGNNDD